jgi:hypothetical protein
MRIVATTCFACAIVVFATSAALDAHAQTQRIRAGEGDTRRHQRGCAGEHRSVAFSHVRAVFNANEHWLIVLARLTDRQQPSTGVDEAFLFQEVEGPWPLGARWEGDASVETYFAAGESGGPAGYGLRTSVGVIQLFTQDAQRFGTSDVSQRFVSADVAATMRYRGWGRSTANGGPVRRCRTHEGGRGDEPSLGSHCVRRCDTGRSDARRRRRSKFGDATDPEDSRRFASVARSSAPGKRARRGDRGADHRNRWTRDGREHSAWDPAVERCGSRLRSPMAVRTGDA